MKTHKSIISYILFEWFLVFLTFSIFSLIMFLVQSARWWEQLIMIPCGFCFVYFALAEKINTIEVWYQNGCFIARNRPFPRITPNPRKIQLKHLNRTYVEKTSTRGVVTFAIILKFENGYVNTWLVTHIEEDAQEIADKLNSAITQYQHGKL